MILIWNLERLQFSYGFWFLMSCNVKQVEHIIREQNIMAAYDILELFCELVAVRLPIIEGQK